jgi:hypothetical protein
LEIESGDFSGKNQPQSTSNQNCEGVEDRSVLSNHSKQQLQVSFMDQPDIEKEINTPIAVSDSSQNQWHMPTPINLDSSGLRHSSRTEVLNRCGKVYSNITTLMNHDAHLHLARPQTTHLRSTSPQSFKYALVLFSAICSFGYGLSCMAHSTGKSNLDFNINILKYHRQLPSINTLYDKMMN